MTDALTLVAPIDAPLAKLVRTLGAIGTLDFAEWCLVGGLAVFCRVGSAHRVTADVDTVVRNTTNAGVLHTLAAGGHDVDRQRLTIGEASVDIIEVEAIQPGDELPDDPLDRLFVVAHHHALHTAQPLTITVVDPDQRIQAKATVRVATAGALVATKLHAYAKRRNDVARKKAGDALDLFALCGQEAEVISELRAGSFGLAALVRAELSKAFVDDADVVAARIRSTAPEVFSATAANVRARASRICSLL